VKLRIEASNATVGVADGVIVSPDAAGAFDVVLRIPDGDLRPGLINAHDHLHRNHYGRLGDPPYANAYDWGRDIHMRYAAAIACARTMPRREALLCGAWKNLRAGVTTVVHHDRWEEEFAGDFPLRVARIASAHSLGFDPDLAHDGGTPFAVHVAEGVDTAAGDELRELDARHLLTRDLLAVHVVGADDDGIRRLREAGAALVWCPTSNVFLFGVTARAELLAPGIDVLLGSDSLLTGEGDLLDELRYARALRLVSDERLETAVGAVAARRLGLPPPSLAVGEPADVIVLTRPLLQATAADVSVVVAGGVLRVLAPELVPALGPCARGGRLVETDGVQRWQSNHDEGVSGGQLPSSQRGEMLLASWRRWT
jgi:cytosine/adenosine deaminase-related metal-dependent hydrolase